jgi:drug/metabolite transporter (DMT)-like permease
MKKGYLLIILAGVLYGGVTFGGQVFVNAGLSLYEISAFTLMFGLLLLPFVLFKKECRFKKSMIGFFLGLGFFGGLLRLSQFGAIVLGVPVAIAVLLLYTQPFWTVVFSRLFLG